MKRVLALLIVVTAVAAPAHLGRSDAVPSGSSPRVPAFHPTDCPDGIVPEDRVVECGYVVVPADRSDPGSPNIRVAAAVVRSTDPTPRPDPIVFLNGGPSVKTIQGFALFAYFAGAGYVAHRDVVLIDTRGVGISRPRLGCPELDRADVTAFYAGRFVYDRAASVTGRALDRCWDRLSDRGVDPSDFTSRESAADIDVVRRALGYGPWNLMVFSADGTIGLNYLRQFPGSIRSAVFDSPIPSNAEWGVDFLLGETAMAERIFAGCRASQACRTAYPGLERRFFRMVDRLNEHPRLVSIPAFLPHPIDILVDGVTLVSDLNWGVWPGGAGTASTLPRQLANAWRVANGKIVRVYRNYLGTGPASNPHRNEFAAVGKTMSYVCHDFIPFLSMADRRRAADEDPAHARRLLGRRFDLGQGWNNAASPQGCQHWPVGAAAPRQHRLVRSDVPTLVFSGAYDAAVAPGMVEKMLPGLTRSTYVMMPTTGHGALPRYARAHWCSRQIAGDFLAAPQAVPDTGCVDSIKPVYLGPPRGRQRSATVPRWQTRIPWYGGRSVGPAR